ncbi:MAG: LytR C-terminal domain-containing protein [Bifidobacteriaceae bacterium]|jgi:hypothetical protein|nr:LytR C-terminal domain-containing protein [Bifidobacteriaceae bacterium]
MPRSKATAESRHQHLRWRQATVFSLLVGALVVALVAAIGMWTGALQPFSFFQKDFKYKPSASPAADPVPCPVGEGMTYPPPTAITVRVLNGTNRQGFASETATALAAHGFPAPGADNAAPYDGVAKLLVGQAGVNNAYTLLRFFPDGTVITLDRREDPGVDAVLGVKFESLRAAEELSFDETALIEPVASCRSPEAILAELTVG